VKVISGFRFNPQAYHTDFTDDKNHRHYSTGEILESQYGSRLLTSASMNNPPIDGWRAYEDGGFYIGAYAYNAPLIRNAIAQAAEFSVLLERVAAVRLTNVFTPKGDLIHKKYLRAKAPVMRSAWNTELCAYQDVGPVVTKNLGHGDGFLLWEDVQRNRILPYHTGYGDITQRNGISYASSGASPQSTALWRVGKINKDRKGATLDAWLGEGLRIGTAAVGLGTKCIPYRDWSMIYPSTSGGRVSFQMKLSYVKDTCLTDAAAAVWLMENKAEVYAQLEHTWCDWSEHSYLYRGSNKK
jgi:hypothetical protein